MLGCDRFYSVAGKVKDCTDQQPIAGASVHIELRTSDGQLKEDDAVTGKDGSFGAVLNEPESDLPSKLTVQASGHVAIEQAVYDPHQTQDICLEPVKK